MIDKNKKLPVPLKYTYPIVMRMWLYPSIKLGFTNITEHYYIPETNKWIKNKKQTILSLRRFNIFNGNFNLWYYKWILKIKDPYNLTKDDIDVIISNLYSSKLPFTKEFIRKSLLLDPTYVCDFFCVGEDIEGEYNRSRDYFKLRHYSYDFSKLKGLFIRNKKEYFTINCLEINPLVPNNLIGEYTTNYVSFIDKHLDHHELKGLKLNVSKRVTSRQYLLKSSNIYGKNSFSIVDSYEGSLSPITLKCNKCGNIFKLSKAFYHFTLKCGGCKNCSGSKSTGECLVENWLIKHNVEFRYNIPIYGIKSRKSNLVKIDFIVIYKGVEIWIEYHGIQHYEVCSFFSHTEDDFERQKYRDQSVREYCIKNNKLLIEIPYTFNTQSRVDKLLDRVILYGEDIKNIVNYENL